MNLLNVLRLVLAVAERQNMGFWKIFFTVLLLAIALALFVLGWFWEFS